jgi:hypothetical protein
MQARRVSIYVTSMPAGPRKADAGFMRLMTDGSVIAHCGLAGRIPSSTLNVPGKGAQALATSTNPQTDFSSSQVQHVNMNNRNIVKSD